MTAQEGACGAARDKESVNVGVVSCCATVSSDAANIFMLFLCVGVVYYGEKQ